MTKIKIKKIEQQVRIPHLKNVYSGDTGWRLFRVNDYEENVTDYKVGAEIKIDNASLTKMESGVTQDYAKVEAVFSVERKLFTDWHDYLNLVSISDTKANPPLNNATTDRVVEIPIEGLNRNFLGHSFIFGIIVVMVLNFVIGRKKKQ